MKAIIKAEVPTVYQLQSIRAFHLEYFHSSRNGSYHAYQEFDTVKKARQYFKELAEYYYEGNRKAIKDHMRKDWLELDACTARIIFGSERKESLNK